MRWRILTVVGLLYSAQFIPLFFAIMALPIILRQEGHSATTIGLVQLAALPYVFKFLWAPLIDRFKIARDRYKSWIVALSGIHLVALVFLAMADPGGNLTVLFVALFIATLSVSTQDVAVDALAISLMRPSERTMGATFQNGGAYVGAVIGGFGFLYIYGQIGWWAAVMAQAVLFVLPLLSLSLVEEPARLRGAPPATFRNAMRFFTQDRIWPWIGILATMRVPLILTMLPMRLMMVDQGTSTEEIAVWFGLFAMCAGGGATAIFGPLLRKMPRVRALYLVGLVNIPVLLGVAYIAAAFPQDIRYAIIIAWVAIAITDIVIFRGAMDKIRPELPGFDFSVQVAIYAIIPGFADPVIGYVIDTQGYLPAFFAAIPAALIPLAILYFAIARLSQSNQGLDGGRAVSTGVMQCKNAAALINWCEEEFTSHGITCTRPEPGLLRMEEMGCLVDMKSVGDSIDILVDTPNDNFLTFLREEITEHLEEFDFDAAQSLKWTGGVKIGELPANFRILRATQRQQVYPGLIRVTLEGIDVEAMVKDGIHIRLMMPQTRGQKPVWPIVNENGGIDWPQGQDKLHARYVTIRDIRPDARQIDVDIAHHEGGLISDWAALQGDDQEIGVMGPMGDYELEHTKNVVLAGDTTALPAMARLIESVEGRITGHLFAASTDLAALKAYLPASDLKVEAMDPSTFSEDIADRVRERVKEPVSYGWFAGEFTAAQSVRTVFRQAFGLDKKTQLSVAYWKAGTPGHQSRAL